MNLMRKCFHWRRASWRIVFAAAILAWIPSQPVADELSLLWQIAPDEQYFITQGHTERGMAYNRDTGHLLVVSRSSMQVHILDAETGAELGQLNQGLDIIFGSSPGGYQINMIGVTEDGVIYVGNLTTNGENSPYKLYRWENETSEPTLVFEGDPASGTGAQRWGDSMDVRGTANNAQILLGSRAGGVAAILTTTDGVTHTPTLISNAHASGAQSVAFGEGDTFWTKLNGQSIRHVSFNLATGAGTLLTEYPIGNTIASIGVSPERQWLAGINIIRPTGTDHLMLFDISDLGQNPLLIDQEAFPGDVDNPNYVGSVDFHEDMVFALDANNGLIAMRVIPTVNPPAFASQPQSPTVLEGGYVTLSANISGTPPYTFQWIFEGANIPNAINPELQLTNVTSAQAGNYQLIAANLAGNATSEVAVVTISPSVRNNRATALWSVTPAEGRTYITTGNTERGIAFNTATGRVLVVSRTGGVNVHVLDGATGEELWTLNAPTDIVNPGLSNPSGFRLNMVGVADDGVVYAANLDTGGSEYTIYRWENDSAETVPTVAFSNAGELPGRRFGDTFDVRGSGIETEILAAYNETGTTVEDPPAVFAVFQTFDGLFFFPNTIMVPDAPSGSTRLGAAFGDGNTIWAKAAAQPLRLISYDVTTLEGTATHTFTNVTSSISAISYLPSSNLIAGISVETPDNVQLWDVSNLEVEPVLLDQDFFPTDNPNANGTGAVDFGTDRLFALNSNNGILALKLNAPDITPDAPELVSATIVGEGIQFTVSGAANTSYTVQSSSDFESWSEVETVTTEADGTAEVTDEASEHHQFYRVVVP